MYAVLCALLALNVPLDHAIGITANVAVETGGSYSYTQRQHRGPAYGLFQMEPRTGLLPSYQRYQSANCKLDSADCQLRWMVGSIYGTYPEGTAYIGGANVRAFLRTRGALEATKQFSRLILRPGKPHMDRRLEAAREIQHAYYNRSCRRL